MLVDAVSRLASRVASALWRRRKTVSEGKSLRIGGYVSGGLLIFFGIAVIVLGVWGFAFTRDHIEREGISFGSI
jgi:hypothetical protein